MVGSRGAVWLRVVWDLDCLPCDSPWCHWWMLVRRLRESRPMSLPTCQFHHYFRSVSHEHVLDTSGPNIHRMAVIILWNEVDTMLMSELFKHMTHMEALSTNSHNKNTHMIMYRRLPTRIPTQQKQRKRFIIRRNQIPCIILTRIKQCILFPTLFFS